MQDCGAWTTVSFYTEISIVDVADLRMRQDEAPTMALQSSSTTHSFDTLGDAAFSSHPEERSISSS